jgi:hypothetical protein
MAADGKLAQCSGRSISLSDLPNEVLYLIMEPLTISDLRNLRLVSKAIVETATPALFRSVTFTPSMNSIARIESIARHKQLRNSVQQIKVCACGMSMDERATVEKQLSSGEGWEKDRLTAEAFIDECEAQLSFYNQMLIDSPEAETHVKRIRDAFASMPNLTEFSLTEFGNPCLIVSRRADILLRTGSTQRFTIPLVPEFDDPGRAIRADDLAFWVRDLRPQVFEVEWATPQHYNSVNPGIDFEHLKNTHTFKLVYCTLGTWNSGEWTTDGPHPDLIRSIASVPAGALDGLSESLLSLRNLTFGFDHGRPLGPTAPGYPGWRHSVRSGEMEWDEGCEEAQLHSQRVMTSSMLGHTFPHLQKVKLITVVTTEEELLTFVERHAEHLRSFAIDNIRVERTVSIHGTLTKLADLLRACPSLKHVKLEGVFLDEHGNYLTLKYKRKKPSLATSYEQVYQVPPLWMRAWPFSDIGLEMGGGSVLDEDGSRTTLQRERQAEIRSSLAELPFLQCCRFVLLGELEDYICRRRDDNPLEDVTPMDWAWMGDGSLYWETFDLLALVS